MSQFITLHDHFEAICQALKNTVVTAKQAHDRPAIAATRKPLEEAALALIKNRKVLDKREFFVSAAFMSGSLALLEDVCKRVDKLFSRITIQHDDLENLVQRADVEHLLFALENGFYIPGYPPLLARRAITKGEAPLVAALEKRAPEFAAQLGQDLCFMLPMKSLARRPHLSCALIREQIDIDPAKGVRVLHRAISTRQGDLAVLLLMLGVSNEFRQAGGMPTMEKWARLSNHELLAIQGGHAAPEDFLADKAARARALERLS